MNNTPFPTPAIAAIDLDEFTRAYIEAAFWTNDDDAPSGDYEKSGRVPIMFAKLAPEAIADAVTECQKFQDANVEWLAQAGTPMKNGVDFWLTRNHHGAGFWDRGYALDVSNGLTAAAHRSGERDLYAGDDGRLYFAP